MPHCKVKQPNGKYAIYSSIVDDLLLLDATADEAIEFELCRVHDYPGGQDALRFDLQREVENIEATGRAWRWAPDWNHAIQNVCFYQGPQAHSLKLAIECGILSRNEYDAAVAWARAEKERLDLEDTAEPAQPTNAQRAAKT